ncbi:glutamine-hydrolyzing GMP synthase [Treponema pedis]|uniref:GMP synthase [glutamine-hydrolyzing] n=2 Tax=Treponema pedis TaxID=409322 RepID=A0A7S6WRQ8_9SPIR|nr:glutamine-hydrolyzing GMP synthase [Treponema pedis]QOW62133.1 glutamine-hydrolyzing GMP synthase [Treponema pedis]
MNTDERILIVDFGGQYNQLIARRVRELNVYSEIVNYKNAISAAAENKPVGIIFTGGPNSVYEKDAPKPDKKIFDMGIPILGICYGMQVMADCLGGSVEKALKNEFGKTETMFNLSHPLFKNIKQNSAVWMSHIDSAANLPSGFIPIAETLNTKNAAMANDVKKLYGIQFHAEVEHTEEGKKIIENFLSICGAKRSWNMKSFLNDAVKEVQDTAKDGKILLALSGGVDSSVLAALLNKAVGKNLTCIFVDHGLMRKNEGDEVETVFANSEMNFIRVNAKKRFLDKLRSVTEPEKKRKIIGEEFIRVFEEEAKKLGTIDFLAQGTIYADIVESGINGSAVIKSHHNVGGLPENIGFKALIEPLRTLFKDEIRLLGKELGLPDYLVYRQPFPGPGLAIRIIGEVTEEKLNILREADAIWRSELENSGIKKELSQYFAVLTGNKSVGVMGDFRTYDYTLALRAVKTSDFMTADWVRIPYEILDKVSSKIINEVSGINRIVYDITSKPPATIEWE